MDALSPLMAKPCFPHEVGTLLQLQPAAASDFFPNFTAIKTTRL